MENLTKYPLKVNLEDDKYLDVSLKEDLKNKRFLEIYSDKPKPLLKNYKFFKGLKEETFSSPFNDGEKVILNFIIENFKVKDAPG